MSQVAVPLAYTVYVNMLFKGGGYQPNGAAHSSDIRILNSMASRTVRSIAIPLQLKDCGRLVAIGTVDILHNMRDCGQLHH